MMKRRIQYLLILIETISALVFFVANWKADRALDKSGIGDPELFTYWNNIAGIYIKAFLIVWIGSIVIEAGFHINKHGVAGILSTKLPYFVVLPAATVILLWAISIL